VLRTLEDATPYLFRIETLGQNGVSGSLAAGPVSTMADMFPDSIRVQSVDVTGSWLGPEFEADAAVAVVSNHGLPIAGAEVAAVWTLVRAGTVVLQLDSAIATTDASGIAHVVLTTSTALPGDVVAIDVPMFRGPEGPEAIPGVKDLSPQARPLLWGESAETSATLAVP
jgi:hypothetical protein